MLTKYDIKIGEEITLIQYNPGVHLHKNKIYIVDRIWSFPGYVTLLGDDKWYQIKLFSNDIKLIRKIKINELNDK